MAVTKRTRYEVLRRDNNACRYCGATAPDVKLTVDHVTPVALGGSDDPSNLVAACTDCNAGKTSTNPDAPLVAQVSDDALRWSQAMQTVLTAAANDLHDLIAYRDMFREAWDRWLTNNGKGNPLPLPADWANTLDMWAKIPVPIAIIEEAVRVAMTAKHVDDKFRYFCGVVWRTLDNAREAVGATLSGRTATPDKCGHCSGCRQGEECYAFGELEEDEEPILCVYCGQRECLFSVGYDEGSQDGWSEGFDTGRRRLVREHVGIIRGGDLLERVIDGRVHDLPSNVRAGV